MSSQALCVKLSVQFGVVCHYFNTKRTDMASKKWQSFRVCVLPCPRYLNGWGYTHSLCCLLGRGPCTVSARECCESTAMCFSCGHSDPAWRSFTMRALRLAFTGALATVLGFANGSVSGVRDEHSLISTFTWQVQCLLSRLGSTRCGFFNPDWGTDTVFLWLSGRALR